MKPPSGFEPETFGLQDQRSKPTELWRQMQILIQNKLQ